MVWDFNDLSSYDGHAWHDKDSDEGERIGGCYVINSHRQVRPVPNLSPISSLYYIVSAIIFTTLSKRCLLLEIWVSCIFIETLQQRHCGSEKVCGSRFSSLFPTTIHWVPHKHSKLLSKLRIQLIKQHLSLNDESGFHLVLASGDCTNFLRCCNDSKRAGWSAHISNTKYS